MNSRVLVFFLMLVPALLYAESITITADQWARPRSGETIADLAALDKLIEAFNKQPGAQLVIGYRKGETGTLWAEELRSWLVSLGIPSNRIGLVSSLEDGDVIVVETTP